MKHKTTYQDVPRETYDLAESLIDKHKTHIDNYIGQLLWWNNKISLISRTIYRQELQEHITHSLIPVLLLKDQSGLPKHIIDCGTGGGLPGIPIAICFSNIHITANDISTKKILAVKDMARQLNIKNVDFARCDVRALKTDGSATVFSKHAFKISFLVNTLKRLNIDHFMFYKGGDIEEELADIDPSVKVISHDLSPIGKKFYNTKKIIQLDSDHE